MNTTNEPRSKISIPFLERDFPINDLDDEGWNASGDILIDRYWSGEKAPAARQAKARMLWSKSGLYVRFAAVVGEPLIVNQTPKTDGSTIGLWERDVCEIFIAPDANEPRKYFEFEIAPTGEWLDAAIDSTSGERITDWEYGSGMQSAARIENDCVAMAINIGWNAFGRIPQAGDIWLANLFRCVGKHPDRGYLAWRPTETEIPSFHVPEKFGEIVFVK